MSAAVCGPGLGLAARLPPGETKLGLLTQNLCLFRSKEARIERDEIYEGLAAACSRFLDLPNIAENWQDLKQEPDATMPDALVGNPLLHTAQITPVVINAAGNVVLYVRANRPRTDRLIFLFEQATVYRVIEYVPNRGAEPVYIWEAVDLPAPLKNIVLQSSTREAKIAPVAPPAEAEAETTGEETEPAPAQGEEKEEGEGEETEPAPAEGEEEGEGEEVEREPSSSEEIDWSALEGPATESGESETSSSESETEGTETEGEGKEERPPKRVTEEEKHEQAMNAIEKKDEDKVDAEEEAELKESEAQEREEAKRLLELKAGVIQEAKNEVKKLQLLPERYFKVVSVRENARWHGRNLFVSAWLLSTKEARTPGAVHLDHSNPLLSLVLTGTQELKFDPKASATREEFTALVQEAIKQDAQYVFIYVGLRPDKQSGHANALVYDVEKKKAYNFEPHGRTERYAGIVTEIQAAFTAWGLPGKIPVQYSAVYPGPQVKEEDSKYKQTMLKIGKSGRCASWCALFWHAVLYARPSVISDLPLQAQLLIDQLTPNAAAVLIQAYTASMVSALRERGTLAHKLVLQFGRELDNPSYLKTFLHPTGKKAGPPKEKKDIYSRENRSGTDVNVYLRYPDGRTIHLSVAHGTWANWTPDRLVAFFKSANRKLLIPPNTLLTLRNLIPVGGGWLPPADVIPQLQLKDRPGHKFAEAHFSLVEMKDYKGFLLARIEYNPDCGNTAQRLLPFIAQRYGQTPPHSNTRLELCTLIRSRERDRLVQGLLGGTIPASRLRPVFVEKEFVKYLSKRSAKSWVDYVTSPKDREKRDALALQFEVDALKFLKKKKMTPPFWIRMLDTLIQDQIPITCWTKEELLQRYPDVLKEAKDSSRPELCRLVLEEQKRRGGAGDEIGCVADPPKTLSMWINPFSPESKEQKLAPLVNLPNGKVVRHARLVQRREITEKRKKTTYLIHDHPFLRFRVAPETTVADLVRFLIVQQDHLDSELPLNLELSCPD